MIVLGITDGITCGAAVLRDGKIMAAVNEERLIRKKMAHGFPVQSVAEVLKLSGVEATDLDAVAVATRNNYFSYECKAWDGWFEAEQDRSIRSEIFKIASSFGGVAGSFPILKKVYHQARQPVFIHRRKKICEVLNNEFGIRARIFFLDHHYAHAASAYYTSGFDDALVVTMDGGGDGCSSHVYQVVNGKFKKLNEISSYDSLGNYYSYVTAICGFKAQKHEGKITGLAAHGKPVYEELLNSLITHKQGQIRNVGKLLFTGALKGIQNRLPVDYLREDLAASIQLHSERIVAEYIRHWLEHARLTDVALAGGVFANVRINQKIHELESVRRIFIHPAMDDGGLAVGAALLVSRPKQNGETTRLRDVYLGPEYSDSEIKHALNASDQQFQYCPDVEASIAELLARGLVVARFNGRMEYGPRALGNRSILYAPTERSVNDWLNKKLRRTEFMPFAPSTLYEYAGKCYDNVAGAEDAARFMTITFNCTNWTQKHCSGVVHVDNTARPQLVTRAENASYYRIIEEFSKITGIPTIINTSFNIHEEPIVCSPNDAIRAFRIGHLDYLAIGKFLVKNPNEIDRKLVPAAVDAYV
jgi:carbamoyltransferase